MYMFSLLLHWALTMFILGVLGYLLSYNKLSAQSHKLARKLLISSGFVLLCILAFVTLRDGQNYFIASMQRPTQTTNAPLS